MTFGVQPSGFVRKTIEDILDELEADQRADIHPDFDVSTTSVPGQLNGIFARQLGIAWETLEQCYHGIDPDAAEGRLLDNDSKLTGTFRVGQTKSEVFLLCDLDDGTTLTAGESFAATTDAPDIRWTPKANYTATADGIVSLAFECETPGPIKAIGGAITTIATPVVGWNSVSNPLAAEVGDDIETDAELRLKRVTELAAVGSAGVRAVTAKLSRAFPGKLESLVVFENDTDETDENGVPPHALEALIYDGEVPSVDNDDVAEVIYTSKSAGINTFGNESGTVTALVAGVEVEKTVYFSRATLKNVWLIVTLTKSLGYVGDDAVREFLAEQANARYGPGDDVVALVLKALPLTLTGVFDVPNLKLGFAAAPTNEANLVVSVREISRFDSSRITIVSS